VLVDRKYVFPLGGAVWIEKENSLSLMSVILLMSASDRLMMPLAFIS
jgi:hypothetical protein